MTVTQQELAERRPEAEEIEVRRPGDSGTYPVNFDDIVRSVSDKRVLATWLLDFYKAFKDLYARMARYEMILHLMARPKVSDEDALLLEAAIAESKSILRLESDFDGRGSPHYSEATWQRAVQFVRLQWEEYARLFGEPMPLPELQPGPHGSIDVYWKTPDFDLLVNIPADPKKEAEFSGDRNGKRKFDGTLDPARPNRGLVSWLVM